MVRSILRCGFLAFVVALAAGSQPSVAVAQKKSTPAQDDAQILSLEVVALQTLSRLDLTAPQLETLLRLSKGAAGTPRSQGAAKITPTFVRTLKSLRNALVEDDEDRIDDLKDKLAYIMDKDKIQLDDRM